MKSKINYLIMILAVIFVITQPSISQVQSKSPKNIIIMIADGWGYNQILCANYYLEGKAKAQVYEDFPVKYSICHYPAVIDKKTGNTTIMDWCTGYNSDSAWTNFNWLKHNPTESSASGTALATGVKTYNSSIGMDINRKPLVNVTEQAKALGKSAGVVTSVEWCHATPAAFVTHNVNRNNYSEIAREMLLDSKIDVIMGAGHPLYNDNGIPATLSEYKYVGDSTIFSLLKTDTAICYSVNGQIKQVQDCNNDGKPDPWTYIETTQEFKKLAVSTVTPKRVCGTARVGTTLQEKRIHGSSIPYQVPENSNVPTLEEMAQGALNVLDRNSKGFLLMIEGGAVDWANHDNYLDRLVEEMNSFNKTVDYVVGWVERNGGWDKNLLIICGDHETGFITGPLANNQSITENPIINNGKGNMPGAKYNYNSHSNTLIPFFAKGVGSNLFNILADEQDKIRGPFIQNSEVAQVVFLLWGKLGN